MSDENALLAAICAEPDEDVPRLAFADWLSEQGGPVNTGWAAGIRAQIQQARGSNDPALTQALMRFESAFLRAHVAERLGVSREISVSNLTQDGWERGFPTQLSGDYAVLREKWPRLANRVPVRHLRMEGVNDEAIADLLAWPGLGRLQFLSLTTWDGRLRDLEIGDRGLMALAGCPALTGLRSLVVSFVALSDTAAGTLLASPYLKGLQALILRQRDDAAGPSRAVARRLRKRFGPTALA